MSIVAIGVPLISGFLRGIPSSLVYLIKDIISDRFAFLGQGVVECGMINLSQETEALAHRLAVAQRLSVEAAIQRALESQARAVGVAPESAPRRRMSVEQMLAFGSEIAAMPVLDQRSPAEIMDDLNAP